MTNCTKENGLLRKKINELEQTILTSEIDHHAFIDLKQRYEDSQVRFKKIFEDSTFGNKIIDSDLKIIKVNKALVKLLGYSEAELLGRIITNFSHPDYLAKWEILQHELWTLEKKSFSIESCLIRKDKVCIWCEITSIIVKDNGELLGYTIIQDITARKMLENKLQQQQQNLLEAIVDTQEEERRRIAENLHNSIGQLLYAAKITLDLVKSQDTSRITENESFIKKSKELLFDCIAESRRMSHELMPKVLDDFGLKAALNQACTQLNGKTTFNCSFTGFSLQANKHLDIAIYRIVQELMLNVIKHSNASRASVLVDIKKKIISIKVKDNGSGFVASPTKKNSIGLQIIKNNLQLFNGKLKVKSTLSKGTEIDIELPNIRVG